MKPLLDMTIDELRETLGELGAPAFRAKQIADWVYRKGVVDAEGMSNVPNDLVGRLEILTSRVVARAVSKDRTVKLLLELRDAHCVECVMIPTSQRVTACLSTQAGCAMGCAFCASGADGLQRNLTAGEILEQVLHLQRETHRHVTNVVLMGAGEPLSNYDATVRAVRALIDPQRFDISARRVTVSTVGLPDRIRRLAREGMPITLAISLHAPNDALRRQIMPLAARYPLKEVIAAAREFFQSRKREVTLEYVLLGGVNDTRQCADALADIAHNLRCNVNLIRYNPVAPSGDERFVAPSEQAVKAFADQLAARSVNVQVRRARGADASAACGQLRARIRDDSAEVHP